jgi:hypothetical protein
VRRAAAAAARRERIRGTDKFLSLSERRLRIKAKAFRKEALTEAGETRISITPASSVKAMPEAGTSTASGASKTTVTRVYGAATPDLVLSATLRNLGAVWDKALLLMATPLTSTRLMSMVGDPVMTVPPPLNFMASVLLRDVDCTDTAAVTWSTKPLDGSAGLILISATPLVSV